MGKPEASIKGKIIDTSKIDRDIKNMFEDRTKKMGEDTQHTTWNRVDYFFPTRNLLFLYSHV